MASEAIQQEEGHEVEHAQTQGEYIQHHLLFLTYGKHPDGTLGRGIQYPFKKPNDDEYHSLWEEKLLDPWKECILKLMKYHAKDPKSKLGQISTEFIPNTDYGEGCKYSLFEQGVECTKWMRNNWEKIKTET